MTKSSAPIGMIWSGAELREARRRAFLTQGELADRLGLTPRSVQRMELGEGEPSARTARALGEVFEVDPVVFYVREKAA